MKRQTIVAALFLVTLLIGGFAAGRAHAARRTHMQAALAHLNKAVDELAATTPRLGGHRGDSISLVRGAILQVEEAIEYARTHQ